MNILSYRGKYPSIHADAFIAPGTHIIGDVEIGADSGIWFGCVVRGDVNCVRIGARTNIQDNSVIHVDSKRFGTFIGDGVTVGHGAILHACTLEDGAFAGMQCCVMDGAVIESGAMLAAGALLTPGKAVPRGELWGGRPARFMRILHEGEQEHIIRSADLYASLAREYKVGKGS
jgi:carbonic anhydrase/acetyltransferase-like protein (isoleucine patch superfamily)